jgi:hypothetical protein
LRVEIIELMEYNAGRARPDDYVVLLRGACAQDIDDLGRQPAGGNTADELGPTSSTAVVVWLVRRPPNTTLTFPVTPFWGAASSFYA